MAVRNENILIFDGACGTNLQGMEIPLSAWQGRDGCNEYLNLSAPEVIREWHSSFLSAGATVLETNTFGANSIVLSEYGLSDRVEEINRAAVGNAHEAIRRHGGTAYVAGSIGPTTKLPSLGHIDFESMAAAVTGQTQALVEAGADLLVIETCQDLLQVKIALVSCFRTLERMKRDLPVMVSLTIEGTGTMLVGSDVAAALAVIEPFPVFSIGLNCATGPEGMTSHIRYLCRHYRGRVSCIPNAGIPQVRDGKTHYPLSPGAFAAQLSAFVRDEGVSIVGGCCGTTPQHIRKLRDALEGCTPARRDIVERPSLASLYQASEIRQEIPPFLIGERCNTSGSKRFRDLLLADDYPGALRVALEQQEDGANAVDLCTAFAGRDEKADLSAMARLFAQSVRVPMVIDSTTPDNIEEALKIHPGRCLVNSVNLEDGGKNLERICRLAKTYGAAVIALTIHEKGMAMTVEEKVATARKIHDLAVHRYGLRPSDLLFDVLTFTIGSGDATLADAAANTLAAIGRVKEELPGVFTVLGVSNISYGLSPVSRRVLNSVFLQEAVAAGLDAAIIDAVKVLPMSKIPAADREVCLNLIHNRRESVDESPLSAFLRHFSDRKIVNGETPKGRNLPAIPPEEELAGKVVEGDKEGLEDILSILLSRRPPASIINHLLVPAMRRVGELFGRGEMLLPFVLQSAEVMKRSVDYLAPFMAKAEREEGRRILLATVAGDVHDIGKNLVDIILSNNGYRVFNLGIKVPAETIIEKAKELRVDAIGLSGLLVKSALMMREILPQFDAAGLRVPVLLGGAALTGKFVAQECVPGYPGPVVYCSDAFAGLSAMRRIDVGTLSSTVFLETGTAPDMPPGPKGAAVSRDNRVPTAPFLGPRLVEGIDPEKLFPYVNEQALFRGRWGYRRGKMTAAEYEKLVAEKVRPMYEALKLRSVEENILAPKVVYGWFRAFAEGDTLVVEHDGRSFRFPFPRRKNPPHLCIADYFRTREEGGDVAGFFVATIGETMARATRELFTSDRYHDYLMLHAFGVEVADALAEYWHEAMRRELGIAGDRPNSFSGYVVQEYQGSRYGFGYPACPDLSAHSTVFELLDPGRIGVTLTESMEMVPEQTTSAIVVHHPQAKYFAT
jgi:5-methyltetrahydrofolate--homocysteine methyltransferase